MLTEDDIKALVAGAKNDLAASLKNTVIQDAETRIRHAVYQEIDRIVAEYCRAELGPIVRERLVGSQSLLVDACARACEGAAEALTKAMVARMTDKLSQSWTRNKLLAALFEGQS